MIPEAEYTFTAEPENTSVYSAKAETLNITEDTCKITIKVPYKNPKTVITTTGATAKLFKYQSNYFVHTVYEPLATVDNGNGTSTHYFAADGGHSYRVSMEGKITKAGYIKTGNSVTVLHSEDDNLPTDRTDYFTETSDAATVGDDSVLLNINQQNHLSLEPHEAKTIKAYRTWQIIDLTYNNHIIEPDFHFNILSGEDVISLEAISNQPTTNGSGNWQKLTAIGEGTAIVLAFAFWYGGDAPRLRGASPKTEEGVAAVQNNIPAKEENTPEAEENKQQKKDGTPETSAEKIIESSKPLTEEQNKSLEETTSSFEIKQSNEEYSEKQEMVINEVTEKDQYKIGPVPEGKPIPIEPENAVITDKEFTCTLYIRCDTILKNIDWFPNYGCSRYQLKAGDKIEWVYTCDLGNDVGGHYSARNGN